MRLRARIAGRGRGHPAQRLERTAAEHGELLRGDLLHDADRDQFLGNIGKDRKPAIVAALDDEP
jgi:hypothetical protein